MSDSLRLLTDFWYLLRDFLSLLWTIVLPLLPVGLWMAYWLWAVNWKKTWPVLRMGAWLPVVLLILVSAGVWSRIAPGPCTCLKFVTIPNFWWQLGIVSTLAALALFCGWLQGYKNWAPAELAVVDPPEGDDHGHVPAHH